MKKENQEAIKTLIDAGFIQDPENSDYWIKYIEDYEGGKLSEFCYYITSDTNFYGASAWGVYDPTCDEYLLLTEHSSFNECFNDYNRNKDAWAVKKVRIIHEEYMLVCDYDDSIAVDTIENIVDNADYSNWEVIN